MKLATMRKSLVCFLMTICIDFVIQNPAMSEEWYQIPRTDMKGDWSRISRDKRGNIKIWTQNELSPDEIRNKKYLNYKYTLSLWVVNCNEEKYTIDIVIDYDVSGNVLNSAKSKVSDYWPIVPGTYGEAMYETLCSPGK